MKKLLIQILSSFTFSSARRKQLRNRLITAWEGDNNRILLADGSAERELPALKTVPGLNIRLRGKNNTLKIHPNAHFEDSSVEVDSNGTEIIIGNCPQAAGLHINCWNGNNQFCRVGDGTTLEGVHIVLGEDDSSVHIGRDCMFSSGIHIWPTDGHALADKETGRPLNKPAGPVTVGDGCWIGQQAFLTKNARVPNHTVVGARAVVTKPFTEEYTVLAGFPAKIIKTNVRWDRKTASRL